MQKQNVDLLIRILLQFNYILYLQLFINKHGETFIFSYNVENFKLSKQKIGSVKKTAINFNINSCIRIYNGCLTNHCIYYTPVLNYDSFVM